jgi:hypothetical protein
VDALRKIHAALTPAGILVDTQPLDPRPPIAANGRRLGTLDLRDWAATITAFDRQFATALDHGFYTLEREFRYVVADRFDTGRELVETVSGWRGTRIGSSLANRATSADPPLTVHQEVGSGSSAAPLRID